MDIHIDVLLKLYRAKLLSATAVLTKCGFSKAEVESDSINLLEERDTVFDIDRANLRQSLIENRRV